LTKNYTCLTEEGGLNAYYEEMPHTIKDAIAFSNSLGEQYIWIGALCIIQDDDDHNAERISRVASIYVSFVFTPIVTSSEDAVSGIPGVLRTDRETAAKLATYPMPLHPGLHCARRKDLIDEYFHTEHSRRGWTFQERLISRRRDYLLGTQASFQCQSAISSEDRFDSAVDSLNLLNPLIE
jgi:hypothetical protein